MVERLGSFGVKRLLHLVWSVNKTGGIRDKYVVPLISKQITLNLTMV